MQRTYLKDVKNGEECLIEGFIETIRDQKSMQFIIIKDISGKIQVTVDKAKSPEVAQTFSSVTVQSVVKIEGKVIENVCVKVGGKEFIPTSVVVLSVAENLPINEETALDMRLDYRWLDLRSDKKTFIFQLQTAIEHYMRDYFLNNNFIEIHSPKLIASASENGSELFGLKYFGQQAYLAQSPQFYKQMAMASGFDRVFEIGPVFRANPSFTSRHDTEFTMLDVEISYIEDVAKVMEFEQNWIVNTLTKIKALYGDKVKELYGLDIEIPTVPFPVVTCKEAEEILKGLGHELPKENHGDLDSQGEKLLYQYIKEKYNHDFVFIRDYDPKARAFYSKRDEKTGLAMAYDLLFKGLEITSGACREHRYEQIKNQIIESKMSVETNHFYMEFFKYGCPPHGGFGFGLSRFTMLLLGIPNVREVTYIYRGPNRLTP